MEVGDAFVLCKVEFLVFAVLLGHLKVAWLLDTLVCNMQLIRCQYSNNTGRDRKRMYVAYHQRRAPLYLIHCSSNFVLRKTPSPNSSFLLIPLRCDVLELNLFLCEEQKVTE